MIPARSLEFQRERPMEPAEKRRTRGYGTNRLVEEDSIAAT